MHFDALAPPTTRDQVGPELLAKLSIVEIRSQSQQTQTQTKSHPRLWFAATHRFRCKLGLGLLSEVGSGRLGYLGKLLLGVQ